MNWPEIFEAAQKFYEATEMGRILATVATIGAGAVLSKFWAFRLHRQTEQEVPDQQTLEAARQSFVHAKNVIWVTAGLIIFTIWASKIAGLILSLAAVAGASLIVSKELIMCLLGYFYITGSRSFRIGDYIEVNGQKGKVVDVDLLATTLVENSQANQQTGRTLSLPNSVWLSYPVRNISATGESIINMTQVLLPLEVDIELAETVALEAAQRVAGEWQGEVNRHLARHEMRKLIDIPSARPKLLWVPVDAKTHGLVIRYGCPINERVNSEQAIFRHFWKRYNELTRGPKQSASPEPAAKAPEGQTKKGVPAETPQNVAVQD